MYSYPFLWGICAIHVAKRKLIVERLDCEGLHQFCSWWRPSPIIKQHAFIPVLPAYYSTWLKALCSLALNCFGQQISRTRVVRLVHLPPLRTDPLVSDEVPEPPPVIVQPCLRYCRWLGSWTILQALKDIPHRRLLILSSYVLCIDLGHFGRGFVGFGNRSAFGTLALCTGDSAGSHFVDRKQTTRLLLRDDSTTAMGHCRPFQNIYYV